MKTKLIPMAFILSFCLYSCSDSLLGEMNRIIKDPVVAEPVVKSFTAELAIEVNWEEDPGADEYVLYRALDTSGDYEILYRGTDLQYSDNHVGSEMRYLYTLVKLRGEEIFGPSRPILGVGSMTIADDYEPNDEEESPTNFLHNLSANVYYYASEGKNHILEDRDWYAIEIRPQMQASFKVEVSGVSANEPTGLMFYLQPDTPEEIKNQAELHIKNSTMEKKFFSFCIYPDGTQIITDTHGGGRVIHYELDFIKEQSIQ